MDSGSLIARCGRRLDENPDFVLLDTPRLLIRLLLFDSYILDCALRYRDVIALVRSIGIENAGLLLEEGGLRLANLPVHMALPGGADPNATLKDPLGYTVVRIADFDEHHKKSIQELAALVGFKRKKQSKLIGQVTRALVRPDELEAYGQQAMKAFDATLSTRNHPLLRMGVEALMLERDVTRPTSYRLEFFPEDEGCIRIGTDLPTKLGRSEAEVRELVGRGVLAVGALDLRFEQMAAFRSVTAFNDADYRLMDGKLAFLAGVLDERDRVEQLRRVLTLAELPSLEDVDLRSIDFGRFVSLRNHPDMTDFRRWLADGSDASDEEIRDRLLGVKARVADVLGGTAVRAARLAITSGVGLVPGIGTAVGGALSVLDEFVLERVLGDPGPLAFFVHRYGSLFEGA
jgi:hypothetical protein